MRLNYNYGRNFTNLQFGEIGVSIYCIHLSAANMQALTLNIDWLFSDSKKHASAKLLGKVSGLYIIDKISGCHSVHYLNTKGDRELGTLLVFCSGELGNQLEKQLFNELDPRF